MKALKTLLVGAATFAAVVAAPALTAPAASDAAVDDTEGVKVMTVHGDRVAYRDEGLGRGDSAHPRHGRQLEDLERGHPDSGQEVPRDRPRSAGARAIRQTAR